MEIAWLILSAGAGFVLLFLMFRPLELAWPAKAGQGFFRPHWWTDCCYLLGQYLLFNGAVFWVLEQIRPWLFAATPEGLRVWIGTLPLWVQAIGVVLVGDLLIYWGHRLQHRVGFLCRGLAVGGYGRRWGLATASKREGGTEPNQSAASVACGVHPSQVSHHGKGVPASPRGPSRPPSSC
jgi:hypothetical protein